MNKNFFIILDEPHIKSILEKINFKNVTFDSTSNANRNIVNIDNFI